MFDDGKKDLSKYRKRTLRLDFSHMIEKKTKKDVSTIGVTNIPPLGATSQSVPLTLTNATTLVDMGSPMNTLSGTSNVVEPTPLIPQKKSLIDLTPIPPMNVDNFQVNKMNQGQSSNPPMNQASDPQETFQPMESRPQQPQ